MEQFKDNIYNINDMINNQDNEKSLNLINTKTISKQYLAYYIYRIITKYIELVESSSSSADVLFFMNLLRIPKEQNRLIPYPMAGRMTNDNDSLDMIILGGIDLFEKVKNYLNALDKGYSDTKFKSFNDFLKEKTLQVIIKDIMDLQKLLPGLSVPIIRPNYYNDQIIKKPKEKK
jgi:hypothetical protein